MLANLSVTSISKSNKDSKHAYYLPRNEKGSSPGAPASAAPQPNPSRAVRMAGPCKRRVGEFTRRRTAVRLTCTLTAAPALFRPRAGAIHFRTYRFWSQLRELNSRPTVYETVALPAELSWRRAGRIRKGSPASSWAIFPQATHVHRPGALGIGPDAPAEPFGVSQVETERFFFPLSSKLAL